MRHPRIVLALGAFFVLSAALAACGGVPGNSVAQIGDQEITKSQFEHWVNVVAKSSQQQTGQTVVVPDPPDYTKCVANLRRTTPKPPKGQPKPTTATFVRQCKAQDAQLRQRAENFLIQSIWLQGEANDRGIKVTDKEIEKRFQQIKKQNFPKEKVFQKFLKDSGQTLADLKLQVRLDLISTKLRTSVTKRAGQIPQSAVVAYYDKHRNTQFTTPARRDILIVLAATKAKAEAALAALKSGQSWTKVAKRYSTDPQTKSTGGLLANAVQADQDKTFGKAAFSAPKGKLIGPIKSQFGWYVFKVVKIRPQKLQPLSGVRSSIRQQLIAQRQNKVLNDFIAAYQDKWRNKTDCRTGFQITGCKQKPKPRRQAAPSQSQQQTPGG